LSAANLLFEGFVGVAESGNFAAKAMDFGSVLF